MNNLINELKEMLELEDFSSVYLLADRIRREQVGDIVHIRAIIEFSNYCGRQCNYCGLNAQNKKVQRYRMAESEIIETAIRANEAGYKTLVLQSGEDAFFTPEVMGEIVRKIKRETELAITLSIGELAYDAYRYLKECGADRYLLKHETADEDLYKALHPCGTLQNRIECLKNIKKLGYETGGGFMIGLPGQTTQTIARDILLLKEIGCDMAGIGPFIAHPDTPLAGSLSGSIELTKRAVALTRIAIPKINLPATTALGVLSAKDKNDVFSCGANVVMKKVTPFAYKRLYEIYPSKLSNGDIVSELSELRAQIRELGREPL